jgi:hypothetical protein
MLGLALVCATACGGAPATDAAVGARLRLVTVRPLVVRGESFRASERVVVTALTPIGPRRVVVRATPSGRFGATFRLPSQPCGAAFAVRAIGALGSRAVVKVPAPPCIPPPRD